jgi:hypothetical protein
MPAPQARQVALEQARDAFLAVIADRYFSVASQALREADPEHAAAG